MGEEAPVTILFTDVEGSTELRTRRGDATAHAMLRAHEDVVRACVLRHGGREVKTLGDGFLLAFASVRRALACAVAIQQELDKQSDAGSGVRVRIGVNTGEVVEEGGDLYGQAVNAAARIAARARAGEILVAEVTKQLAGAGPEFVFRDRGRLRLKGFPERWRLYRLLWAPESEPGAIPAARRTPFVGRERERAELRQLLDATVKGAGGLVLIGGEPGVGKTRLAEELMSEAARRDVEVFEGHSYEVEGAPPYVPFVEILESALARASSPADFQADLGSEAPEVVRLLPKLGRLCPDIPSSPDLPAEQERRYLFNSIRDVLARRARRRPLLLLLDDLQWADDPTLRLLLHLADRLPASPLLIVATYRDTDVGRPLTAAFADLRRRPGTTWMALKRLSEDGVAAMLRAMSGQEVPAPLVRALYGEAEGNPFFLEELYKHLVEEGRLFDADGCFHADVEVSTLDVPEGIRLVIGHRLERLGADGVRVLAAAAIAGRVFSFDLLEEMVDVDADMVLDTIEAAERARLVHGAPDTAEEDRFIFAHELIRQTLVAGCSAPRRRRLHARAAKALEARYSTGLDEHAAAVAHHLQQAGAAADRVFPYLVRAGRWALTGAAFEDALRHYEAAAALAGAADAAERAELLLQLGMARRSAGHWDTAIDAWRLSLEAYEEIGDEEAIGRGCLAASYNLAWAARWGDATEMAQRGLRALGERGSGDRSRLLGMAGAAAGYGGDHEASKRLIDEALSLAERLDDDGARGLALLHRAMTAVAYVEQEDGVGCGLRAAELLRAVGDLWSATSVLGFVLDSFRYLGRLEELRHLSQELGPLAERLGNHGALLMHGRANAMLDFFVDTDLDRLERFAQRDRALCEGAGIAVATSQSWAWAGLAQFLRGRWDEARRLFEEAVRIEAAGAVSGWSTALLFECLAYRGERAEALALLESRHLPGVGEARTSGGLSMLGSAVEGLLVLGERERAAALYASVADCLDGTAIVCSSFIDGRLLHRVAGIAAMAGRHRADAEAHFQRALAQADALPHRPEQAHTRRFYGQMLLERDGPGDAEQARTTLRQAMTDYDRMGMPRHRDITATLAGSASKL